jgi:hypothetical protein
MSVQKVFPDFSIVTKCPLLITPAETVLTYQTASAVSVNRDVNGRSSQCFPNDYAYLQNKPIQKPPSCCSNNALTQNNQTNVNSMNYGSMNNGY